MPPSDLTVRYVRLDEAAACNKLHNVQYNLDRNLKQWHWEFVSCIFSHTQIPFSVVADGGTIVGTQAFIPIQMINKDGVYWTAKSEETLLESDYRGRGLLKKMYFQLFEYAAEHGLRYVWGFTPADKALREVGFDIPTQTSQLLIPFYTRSLSLILKRAGAEESTGIGFTSKMAAYRCGFAVARLISAVKLYSTERRVKRSASSHSLVLQILDKPPLGADSLCRRFVAQWGGTTIYRDEKYLRWRIFENPYTKPIMCAVHDGSELIGWVIYSIDDDGVGYLVDILVATEQNLSYAPEDVIRMLLVKAVRSIRDMGAVAVRGWHVNNHPFSRLVTRIARSVGFHFINRGQSVVVYTIDPKYAPVCDNFDDWYVTRLFMEGTVG